MLPVQVFALASICGYFQNIQLPPSHKEIRNQRKWRAALGVNGPRFHPEVTPSLNHCLRSLQSSSPEKAPPTTVPSTRDLSRFQPDEYRCQSACSVRSSSVSNPHEHEQCAGCNTAVSSFEWLKDSSQLPPYVAAVAPIKTQILNPRTKEAHRLQEAGFWFSSSTPDTSVSTGKIFLIFRHGLT